MGSFKIYFCFLIGFCASVQGQTLQEPDVRIWHFPYVGENAIPCIPNESSNCLTLAGFEADGKGRFYIAGGDPLAVATYEGNHELYRRTVGLPRLQYGMMKLYSDSLYIFNDRKAEVVSMSVDGKGEIRYYSLPIDTCNVGYFLEPCYLNVWGVPHDVKIRDAEDILSNSHLFHFRLPNNCVKELSRQEALAGFLDSLKMRCNPFWDRDIARNLNLKYIGAIDTNAIYIYRDNYEIGIIHVYSRGGKKILEYPIPNMPALCPLSDDGTVNEHTVVVFEDNTILRGDRIYLIGFMPKGRDFQILEINIKNIIKKHVHGTR